MMEIVPIGGIARRLPQAGRIRLGERKGVMPRSINTFRFTAPVRRLLEPVAEVHGGSIRPWSEGKAGDRFELRSEANEIDVHLPPHPLTEAYELYDPKRGFVRRCDSRECAAQRPGPEGMEQAMVPCLCRSEGLLKCKYKMRLSVLLPQVETLGVWRLDTSSENARAEIPAVVETIVGLQGEGFYRAKLRIENRTSPGKNYNVPVLDPGVSLDTLLSGATRVMALPGSPPAALPTSGELTEGEGRGTARAPIPSAVPPSPPPDDDVVDGEIVEEVEPTIARAWLANLGSTHEKNAALRRAVELASEMGEPLPTTAAAISGPVLNRLAAEMIP